MAKSVLSEAHFQNAEAALEYIEARLWPNGPVCPKCGATSEHIGALNGKTTRKGLRKCYACEAPFTVLMGTIFESSHLPLNLWLQAIHLMCASKNGISTRELQRLFQCSMKTAWHLTHRIREAMKDGGLEPLGGAGKVLEADTSYVGGKEKNKRLGKRNAANIGGAGKQIVHAIVERNGRVRAHHIPRVNGETLRVVLDQHADRASALMTDTAGGYLHVGRQFARHEMVDHGKDEYVRGDASTNTVEGYFSVLKRGLTGTYHAVSEAHLHRYLAEFCFRYSNRQKLGIDDVSRAEIALKGFKGKRLTYRTTRRERRAAAT
ncbi:MAG: IS1595 family transposase [Hyphomonadaceae bacterium]